VAESAIGVLVVEMRSSSSTVPSTEGRRGATFGSMIERAPKDYLNFYFSLEQKTEVTTSNNIQLIARLKIFSGYGVIIYSSVS